MKKRTPSLATSIAGAAVLIVVYALSLGPVLALAEAGYTTERSPVYLGAAYAPIFWLMQESETARSFYDWYLGLWVDGIIIDHTDPPGRELI